MGKIVSALKNVGKAVNGVEPSGRYISDVLNSLATDYAGVSVLQVANVQTLTTAQCNALKAGDVVVKNENGNKHTYVVSYKEDEQGLCLTYTDCENVETVAYDYSDGEWVFNSKDVTHIGQ